MVKYLILFLLLIVTPVLAHDWYPFQCCGGRDCTELRDDEVKEVQGGYLVRDKFFVPTDKAMPSPDEHYHGCWPQPEVIGCFWAPVPNT